MPVGNPDNGIGFGHAKTLDPFSFLLTTSPDANPWWCNGLMDWAQPRILIRWGQGFPSGCHWLNQLARGNQEVAKVQRQRLSFVFRVFWGGRKPVFPWAVCLALIWVSTGLFAVWSRVCSTSSQKLQLLGVLCVCLWERDRDSLSRIPSRNPHVDVASRKHQGVF